MQQTPNLNLNKPDGTDVVDIEDLNENMDIIDGKLGTTGHDHSGTGPKIAYSNLTGAPTSMPPTAHASTATTYGVSSATNYGHAKATSAAPIAAGMAAVGTDNGLYARGDHVHPAQTSITGNAATATSAAILTTARTIALSGKVTGTATPFDGSANISIPVTAVTADSCTGNSATATKLATARSISLTGDVTGSGNFDGSGNVSITTTASSSSPFTKEFISSEQTITSGGSLTIAHSLGAIPKIIGAVLKCTSAENGYSVGDLIYISPYKDVNSNVGDQGMTVKMDASNLYVRFTKAGDVFSVYHGSTNEGISCTNAKWALILKAWA